MACERFQKKIDPTAEGEGNFLTHFRPRQRCFLLQPDRQVPFGTPWYNELNGVA